MGITKVGIANYCGKNFYKLIDSILKKLILFFKTTKNKKLARAALSAIYRSHRTEPFLLKIQKQENFIVHCNELISRNVFLDGSFDFIKFEKVVSIIKTNNDMTTLVDIGANIGTIAIPALTRHYFKEVILIEPEEKKFQILMANIYLNGLIKKVTAHNIALTDEGNSSLYLKINQDNNYGDHRIFNSLAKSDTLNEKNIRAVRGETLDKVAPNLKKGNALIWMDVQGHEGIVLNGMKQSIKKQIPMVLEFTPSFIKDNNSYDYFKLLLRYSVVYDLNQEKIIPIKFSETVLKNLFDKYYQSKSIYYTDLLFM